MNSQAHTNIKNKHKEAVYPTAGKITEGLIRHVNAIAEDCGADVIFVYVDALTERNLVFPEVSNRKVVYVTKTAEEDQLQSKKGFDFVRVPNVPLSRTGQIKIAILLALTQGILKRGDTIIFLSGTAASGTLDTLMIMQVGDEFELFLAPNEGVEITRPMRPEVLCRVLDIASELGSEGREGKAVGALFVIGDTERVLSLSRPLVLNPFRGYPKANRNILDPKLEETVKEFAMLDGAFLIHGDGTIESAGIYLKTVSQQEFDLPQGLGARHHAAAAISAVSESVAVTVSESTGTVTLFRNGRIVTEIEKLRTLATKGQYLANIGAP